jgi:hypothetical protein
MPKLGHNNYYISAKECQTYSYRKIDNYTAANFLLQLSYETWDDSFGDKDVNLIFNSFLNTYIYFTGIKIFKKLPSYLILSLKGP